ncbi:VENN motif pre-toxin domain-containing protein [Exercitatus varius]|uniref:VENN motif pre-toxin domain-containing protein n=1 Tax=Exercitatus varius TaxID=67857 RepID=UPI00294B94E5|nr:VENN motif pre-toxin domain-containing protein [Exercitatus varius]MDG2943753.1 VENN motif pre-toxin domain-containing protein [Exercitatus varius]
MQRYDKGGDYQLAVRAVTGVLQGLATGNQNAAWVNGLSPYANNLIKTYTTDESGQVNTTANLMAHAMLGALEAYATGNHAAAGAAGAITSEVAAKLITEQLYLTAPDKLTDDQKQVVATLSQVTAGLAGIVTSDSTQSAVSAAEIGKRAVENNLLSRQEDKQVYDITEEYRSKGMLPKYKQEQVSALLTKDTEIDRLLYLYQTEPEKLTEAQKAYLDRELKVIAASYDIPIENLYQWDFSHVLKRDDSALKNYLSSGNALNDSYDMKQAQSLKQGLEVASVMGVNYGLAQSVWSILPKVGQGIEKYPLLTEMGATAIANIGYQLSQDRPYDPYGLLQAKLSTENDEDYDWNALGYSFQEISNPFVYYVN